MLQDLFKKFANKVVELHYETIDLASDSQLSAEVVPPELKRDFASPSHTTDDDVPLRVLRKNIKIEKGV